RLIGAPPGYVGFEEGGQLTEKVRRRPYCVILFDEIEKAHTEVHNVLLQLFDDGRLTDGKGRVVDFTNTVVICTSNVGADVVRDNLHRGLTYNQLKDDVMSLLNRRFRPEFLNRIDDIIVFHALSKEQIKEIVRLQLGRVGRAAHGQGVLLSFDPTIVDHLAEIGYVPEFGARELKRKIRTELETRLATEMLKGEVSEGDHFLIHYDEKSACVKMDKQKVESEKVVV
ncbi:MAG: AAA family ATPase, partial [Cyanobacteria bacterium]|nr:AAA family ATPase [Cyanobacteriota bacterium]